MRFLFVELSPSGGLFQFSFQLGRSLAVEGHDVEMLTGPRPELTSDVAAFRLTSRLPTWHAGSSRKEAEWLRRPRRALRAVQHVLALVVVLGHVRRTKPQVVFWHPLRFPFDSWFVLLTRRLCPDSAMCMVLHEPRPVVEQRGSGSLHHTGSVTRRSLAAAVARMDVVFVLSDRVRAEVEETYRPRGRVIVIPHGNEDAFLADGEVGPVEATGPRALFFGTWTRYKGIDDLLEAWKVVRQKLPDAELTLAGAVGGDLDYAATTALAASVGGVTLLPGYVALPDVRRLFEEARVVALPYRHANQSGVAHLAQTFSRPVVATDVGDIPHTVRDAEAGLVVPPGDVPALADALVRVLDDPALAGRMGANGRLRLGREASWDDIARTVATAVTEVRPPKRP